MHISQFLAFLGTLAAVNACLLPGEAEGGHLHAKRRASSAPTVPIHAGDRFEGGAVAPRGLGSQPAGTKIGVLMNTVEIKSAVRGLVRQFGIQMFTTPDKTSQGATMFGGKVGNGLDCDDAYRVYLTAGVHARERGASDNLIYFISDLLWAQRLGTGLTYGNMKYTHDDVLIVLSTGIIFMPLVNPDGVKYDQATGNCWRKNRNPSGAVDLNRNFDFLWDYETAFAPNLDTPPASSDPDEVIYHGTSAFSEPETRNVKWVMDKYPKLRWYVDLHSYSGSVLYPWGDDTNQVSDPKQSFTNPDYDGKRGKIPDTSGHKYKEYITKPDWDAAKNVATKVASGMKSAAKRKYDARQSAYLYPSSGTSADYAFSRSVANGNLNKLYGFTIEFGFGGPDIYCSFYPSVDQFHDSILETGAGFMEFLLTASQEGLGSSRECPSEGPSCPAS
ncbi:hypothetical protein G7Z17_g9077 [Cylindrodendrum hubeiense]|uniref:Peptidase M14 domain-containing protein n=1 Tax=Cylindrodendrum hubeiense TaxID=595255 RepID=A0A9P5H8H9_9HYPO|nr:hypothetical protein G7Z17_g9077 [Cylindrodendrum hubeiense]